MPGVLAAQARSLLPVSADATRAPAVLDQGQQGSCTGFGTTAAVWSALCREARALGRPDPEQPSPAWNYLLGRIEDGDPSQDNGSTISSVLDGVSRYGFVSDDVLPYSDSVLEPPPSQLEELKRLAYDQRTISGTSRIVSTGTKFRDDIRASILAGYMVVFGTDVDQAFEDLSPGKYWPGVKGQVLGGHCMAIDHYDASGVGGPNSWGTSWCDKGRFLAGWSAVDSFGDAWIVSVVPQYSGTV